MKIMKSKHLQKKVTKKQFDFWRFLRMAKKVFDYLSDDDQMLEEAPMTKIAKDNQMTVFNHKGFWHAMDTPRDYEYLNKITEILNS